MALDSRLKNAKEANKNLKLAILGQGPLEDYLRVLIKDLKLEKDVHLLSWQKNPFKFFVRSKLFVLTSLWEGLSMVVLEAMTCGIPILAADCKSGPREILAPNSKIDYQAKGIERGEYGILIPPLEKKFYRARDPLTDNEKMLAEAIIKISTDENLQNHLREKSKERARDFDVKNIIEEWDFLWK